MLGNFIYFLPVLLGIVCGVMFGFSTGHFAIKRYLAVAEQSPALMMAGYAAGLVAIPFVCFTGWVVGGKLGAYMPTAWGSFTAPIGVGVGIFIVESVLVALALIFGVLAWKGAQKRLGRRDAT